MKTRKKAILIVSVLLLIAVLTGCSGRVSDLGVPDLFTFFRTEKFVNQSYLKRHEDFSKSELGGIRKDSRFTACSHENLLRFCGYYKGLDFVTLVFESSSPVEPDQLQRVTDQVYNARLQGIIYYQDSSHKYVTYQYEPAIYEKNGEPTQKSSVNDSRFSFKLNDRESETYYQINIKGLHGKYLNKDLEECDMEIRYRIQKEAIEQSCWTDYRYDETRQFYHSDTEKWNTSMVRDMKTDYMPLE